MKLVKGITWSFNPKLEPKNLAEWDAFMKSETAWMRLSHKGTALFEMPLDKFDMEPKYTPLTHPLPASELRIDAPIWAVWALDLVEA